MTALLPKALAEVKKLAPEARDTIAALILEELEDKQRRGTTFAATQLQLAKLAEKAREDIRAGHVRKIQGRGRVLKYRFFQGEDLIIQDLTPGIFEFLELNEGTGVCDTPPISLPRLGNR